MNFFSDTREAERRFGDYIEDLHDVFRCHRIDFGSPSDFVVFGRAVRHQGELRDDVMRVVKSLREDEASISFRTILTVVAVASGGPEVAMSEWEMSVPVQYVVESLNNADTGVQDSVEPADLDSINPSIDSLDQGASNDLAGSGADRGHSDSGYSHSGYSDSGYSDTLAESLTRLELNSLQLKTYLDSIEQRIARIEPRPKDIASPILAVPPVCSLDESEIGYLASVFTESESRQPHDNHPGSNQGGFVAETAGVSPGFRRSRRNSPSFSRSLRRGALPILVSTSTLVLAGSLLWVVERGSADGVTRSSTVDRDGQSSLSDPALGVHDPLVLMKEPQQEAGQVSDLEVGPALTPKKSAEKTRVRSSPRKSLSQAANAETQPVASPATSETGPSDEADEPDSGPPERRPLDVSSDVMAANLVSSSQPSYPLLANLAHMQGSVVMRAVISREGTVERLHVIKGHRLLRGAAKSAVQSWRYRPYKVDGVPVEVATVVSVDFSRHREVNP
jgi:TonB family protein